MERRQFLSLTLGTLALAAIPARLTAEDYRKLKPTVWTAHTVDDAMKNLYGSTSTIQEGVTLTAPDVASNGGAIPVTVKSDIDAKTVAVFQDVNPESAVAVYDVPDVGIIDYYFKMKMKKLEAKIWALRI